MKVAIKLNISNLSVSRIILSGGKNDFVSASLIMWDLLDVAFGNPLIKMNFDATDSYAGLCLSSPAGCWQAANPPLSYQLLLKSGLSFHQAGPVDGNEFGIFRTTLIQAAAHNSEKRVSPNIHCKSNALYGEITSRRFIFTLDLSPGCASC